MSDDVPGRHRADLSPPRADRQFAVTRRRFGQLAGFAAAPFFLAPGATFAQEKSLTLVNRGGDAITGQQKAFVDPFEAETGIHVNIDGSGATEGAVMAQFQSGAPSWDILDMDPFSAIRLGRLGMLEEIDYDIIDRSKLR